MNPIGQRALRFYLAALRFFWTPLLALARFVTRHPILVTAGILLGLTIAFVLKTGGVLLAEFGAVTIGRIAIAVGGAFDLAATSVVSAIGALLLYWVLIAVGMVQIPIGEIMEVLRELGQMLRLQDPVKRDNEGNIRAINTEKLLQWGMLLLMVPGMALMSTLWLAVFPSWTVYAMLLLITVGGLAVAVFAAARGRKIGRGLDLLIGMNAYLVVGGVITMLYRFWLSVSYPLSVAVAADGPAGLTRTSGLPWDNDWALASLLSAVAEHGGFSGIDITAYPGAVGAALAIAFWGLVAVILHVVTIVMIVRMLLRPPGQERISPALPADAVVSGTVGKGDSSGFSGFEMNGWFWGAIGLGITAAILWLVNHHASGEWVCRFGGALFTLAWVAVLVTLVAGLLQLRWPRFAAVAGTLALCVAAFVFVHDALGHWDGRRMACGVVDRPHRTASAAPVHDAPRESPPPSRRSDPWAPARAEDGRIRAYFAEHRDECPDAAARTGWESYRDAVGACRSESWRIAYSDY